MSRRATIRVVLLGGLAAVAAAAAFAGNKSDPPATHPLRTGVFDPELFGDPAAQASAFRRVHSDGASVVRLILKWSDVAPAGVRGAHPRGFNSADPAARQYHWAAFDRTVRAAHAAGLEPLVDIVHPPDWARTGKPPASNEPWMPDASEFGRFAHAAAMRYSGRFQGLPRVRYWQAWNEPNLTPFLTPQLVNKKPVSPGVYRRMVNAFAVAVKGVHADNIVVAGGLGPFRDGTKEVLQQNSDWGPLAFMRDLFCLSKSLKPTCDARVRFDVWAIHPYTSGGPTHSANLPNDVSLGDLPKLRRVLNAAARAGHIESRRPIRLWVTEFSWDSKPPDPEGAPDNVLRYWVPQALYTMWRQGISLVTWFTVRDYDQRKSFYQSGLYYLNGKPKPYIQGFRFPLVAFKRGGGVYVWGRTPAGKKGRVLVEQRVGGKWKKLGVVRSDRYGIFQRRFGASPGSAVRGQLVGTGERTMPFSLTPVPDHFYRPFGVF
jgi:hypothetical protein